MAEADSNIDITIVGGGVVGLSTAAALTARGYDVAVFEKGRISGEGQSGHNSGVIHSGAYYDPGSLKARLCVAGNRHMYETCARYHIPHRRTGKLVVATDESQLGELEKLFDTAAENGVVATAIASEEWMRMLSSSEIKRYEPNICALAALYIPSTGIFDAARYCSEMKQCAERQSKNGKIVFYGTAVTDIEPHKNGFTVHVFDNRGGSYAVRSRFLVNAAGIHADEIGRMINPEFPYTFVSQRGDYFSFNSIRRPEMSMNGHCVYPLQILDESGKIVNLGIHLTPTFDDTILVGPSADVVENKDGKREEESGQKEEEKFVEKQRTKFFEEISRFKPGLTASDLKRGQHGVTMRIYEGDTRITDFVIEPDHSLPRALHMLMPSPGFTSAEPAGKYAAGLISEMDL